MFNIQISHSAKNMNTPRYSNGIYNFFDTDKYMYIFFSDIPLGDLGAFF